MNDLISRKAVLDKLKRLIEVERLQGTDEMGYGRERVSAYETMIFSIGNLPSVSTEKTGRWIGHREHCENLGVIPSGLGAYEWCSNCDCGIDVREWHRNNYNYCPNCGCQMEVEE